MTPFLDSDIDEIVARIADEARELAGRRLLLAGGAGFLGKYFVEVLRRLNRQVLETPVEVTVIDCFVTGRGEGVAPECAHFTFLEHDIIKPLDIEPRFDYIVHAAGIASPYYYRAFPLRALEVSTIGSRNLLEVARRCDARFLFLSSSEVYGDPDPEHVPTAESYRGNVSTVGPRACYDEGKRAGETICHIFHDSFGVHTNCIRPFNVFGPGMPETDYRVLPNFASCIKGERSVSVYGSGRQTRTYCYVTDAMVGFFLVLLKGVPGSIYNIGTPTPEISVLELLAHIEAVIGRPVPRHRIEYPDSYPGDEPQRRCPDIRKAQLQLGYRPEVDLRTGLRRFFDWTAENYTGNG